MDINIRPVQDEDIEDLVKLSLLAWEPIFVSFRGILGGNIYSSIWPDWKSGQREAIETVCSDGDKTIVWVAEVDTKTRGFIAYTLDFENKIGDIQLLAVHPDYQNLGIGTTLNTFALDKMKETGMKMAKVETGGDPSHAPARRAYEKSGFTGLPLVRYFQDL